jgi:DNA-binding HxlR family transcriptional regulator
MSCGKTDLEAFQCDTCTYRDDDDAYACPARWFFQQFGDKWSLPVLGSLVNGPMRFSQMRKELTPISERMLILTLKKLEESGFIIRGQSAGHTVQNNYGLTPQGISLLEHVGDLFQWTNANVSTILKSYETRTR